MPKPKTILLRGQIYHPVPVIARLLGTTAPKVRALMGVGSLDWRQTKDNGAIVVSAESVRRYLGDRRANGR